MRKLIDRLAHVPLQVVGAALTLGAVLLAAHYALIDHVRATGQEEPAQWVGGLTVKWYWVLIPVSLIALWARRRDRQGPVGRAGAIMLTAGPLMHVTVTVGAIIWGALMGRGDLPNAFMMVEMLMYVFYLGVLVIGLTFLLDGGVRWWGAATVAGLVLEFLVPYGGAAAFTVFGLCLVAYGLRRPVAAGHV